MIIYTNGLTFHGSKIHILLSCIMAPRSLVSGSSISEDYTASYHEDGSSKFLKNVGTHLPNYKVS
jgi:hypothetical protein